MLILHVTNGDHAAAGLARSGLHGDVLSWRDMLHDGPVRSDTTAAGFRLARAEFLAAGWWTGSVTDVVVDFEERDARLAGISADDEVVLWFEPDLYDQLQLVQVLAAIGTRPPADRPRVSIVPADCYLGPMQPEKFRPLFETRRSIGDSEFALGTEAWCAFTASTPVALPDVAARLDSEVRARTYDADESVRLPYLAAALRRQLQEYPDREHGLSRSERQLCEALAPGEIVLSKLYHAAHHASESWHWLGDSIFAWYVQRLSECAEPLVTHPNGTRVISTVRDTKHFWERTVILTPFGHEVVRARADAIEHNGIDRWIGGVHLTTADHWRWDDRVHRVVHHSTQRGSR